MAKGSVKAGLRFQSGTGRDAFCWIPGEFRGAELALRFSIAAIVPGSDESGLLTTFAHAFANSFLSGAP